MIQDKEQGLNNGLGCHPNPPCCASKQYANAWSQYEVRYCSIETMSKEEWTCIEGVRINSHSVTAINPEIDEPVSPSSCEEENQDGNSYEEVNYESVRGGTSSKDSLVVPLSFYKKQKQMTDSPVAKFDLDAADVG